MVTNDRWGYGSICTHGGYYTCADRYLPGHLIKHKWENCMTIDTKSWGYRRNAPLSDYLNIEQLVAVRDSTFFFYPPTFLPLSCSGSFKKHSCMSCSPLRSAPFPYYTMSSLSRCQRIGAATTRLTTIISIFLP